MKYANRWYGAAIVAATLGLAGQARAGSAEGSAPPRLQPGEVDFRDNSRANVEPVFGARPESAPLSAAPLMPQWYSVNGENRMAPTPNDTWRPALPDWHRQSP